MTSTPIYISEDTEPISTEQLCIPQHYKEYISGILIPHGFIIDRIEAIAKEIHKEYTGKSIYLIAVLKGGDRVFGDLTKKLDILNASSNNSIPMSYEFIKVSSYNNTKSTGTVKIIGDLENCKERDILIVEDIIDTGNSMKNLVQEIKKHNPKSIKVFSLLIKRITSENTYAPDYAGFSIPNHFVVGYCLDYNEHFRDLPHIGILNNKGKEKYEKKE